VVRRLAGLLVVLAALGAPAGAQALKFRSGDGLRVLTVKQLDSRLIALSVSTKALPGPANVRVLLPTGYAKHRHRRYPVLYLLHGTSGGASDWTTMGDAEQTTAGKPLIVVMPDIGLNDDGGGWCTNWWNGGRRGVPEWETFHIDQLIPWIDRNLRAIRSRSGRAIAGLSQGGFCSTSYAARHPDLFGTTLSFSGAPDIAYDAEAQTLVTPIINATETVLDRVPANSMFGPRSTEEINWAAHDPTTLAENLADTRILMFTGNGQPGPYDTTPNPAASAIEAGVEVLTKLFHDRLQALGIPSYFDDYGPGTHSWPYWARDLRQSIGPLMYDFAHPLPPPAKITYMAAESTYTIYGWQVRMHRAVEEFSTLSGADRRGFSLSGSGSATVTTPALYRRHRHYRITVGSTTRTETAGRNRRLIIQVPLGPSNTVQEYPLDGPSTATKVYTTRVTINS
jgi:S-formylglutathione hydrolase FrmB